MVERLPSAWAFAPGLLLIGLGLGVMLTPSVNVVQSSFPEELQGEISGLSRSVSNLGSSLGTAVAGTILVAGITTHAYGAAMITLAVLGLVGLVAAAFLPGAWLRAPLLLCRTNPRELPSESDRPERVHRRHTPVTGAPTRSPKPSRAARTAP